MSSGESIREVGITLYGQGSFDQLTSAIKAKENELRVAEELKSLGPSFFVGPNGKAVPAKYKNWIGTNRRSEIISKVQDEPLANVVRSLYRRNAFIGDGGTADVIRFEKETGLNLGRNGGNHVKKGWENLRRLEKILGRQNLSRTDREIAEKLAGDLRKALEE